MEFTGQIIKVLPPREGVSERTGNQWKAQGFVFEYKEHDTDPWFDRVYLETFDTNQMPDIVVGAVARIGFRHSAREYNGRMYNDVRMNNFVLVGKPMEANQPAQGANQQAVGQQPAAQQAGQQQAPFPPHVDAQGNPITQQNQGGDNDDDLPF